MYVCTYVVLRTFFLWTPPPQYQRGSPKQIMCELRQRLHYIPDEWLSKPHTSEVHRQFTQVFQFRVVSSSGILLGSHIVSFCQFLFETFSRLQMLSFSICWTYVRTYIRMYVRVNGSVYSMHVCTYVWMGLCTVCTYVH